MLSLPQCARDAYAKCAPDEFGVARELITGLPAVTFLGNGPAREHRGGLDSVAGLELLQDVLNVALDGRGSYNEPLPAEVSPI